MKHASVPPVVIGNSVGRIAWGIPDDHVPRYLLRDRDGVFGSDFGRTSRRFGIEAVVNAPRSLWQNPCVKRVIGASRRLRSTSTLIDEATLVGYTRNGFVCW